MILSVGFEISISDLTSEILPKDPLSMIFPFTEEDTNISLKISLLKLSRRALRLPVSFVLGVVSNYLVESVDFKSFYFSYYLCNYELGTQFRICYKKVDLSYLNSSEEYSNELVLIRFESQSGIGTAALSSFRGYLRLPIVSCINLLSFLNG